MTSATGCGWCGATPAPYTLSPGRLQVSLCTPDHALRLGEQLVALAVVDRRPSYTVSFIGGMVPTQSNGLLADGRPYYFRARGGSWTLEIGEQGWQVDYRLWPRDHEKKGRLVYAEGLDNSMGAMTEAEVLAVLDRYLPMET